MCGSLTEREREEGGRARVLLAALLLLEWHKQIASWQLGPCINATHQGDLHTTREEREKKINPSSTESQERTGEKETSYQIVHRDPVWVCPVSIYNDMSFSLPFFGLFVNTSGCGWRDSNDTLQRRESAPFGCEDDRQPAEKYGLLCAYDSLSRNWSPRTHPL